MTQSITRGIYRRGHVLWVGTIIWAWSIAKARIPTANTPPRHLLKRRLGEIRSRPYDHRPARGKR